MIFLERKPPVNLVEKDTYLFKREFKKQIPGADILDLKNIILFSSGVCYKGFRILTESLIDPIGSNKERAGYFIKNILRSKFNYLPPSTRYLLAFDEWSWGYFHWMTDTLQRIYCLKNYFSNHVLLLPDYFREPYHLKTLEALGVNNIRYLKKRSVSFVKNSFFATHVAITGNNDPVLLNKVARTLKKKLTETFKLGKRIYISRSKAAKRKILNEDEVIRLLSQFEFEIVCMEDYSFTKQISIAGHATHMVSIHGAGLTNMMFMNPGCKVLELRREEDIQNNCYFSLASDFGLDYYYQICSASDINLSTQEDDMIVDIQSLKKNIESMIE